MKGVHGSLKTVEWPAIGSWWRENDRRGGTVAKQVVAHRKADGRVGLQGVMLTWALAERFNGKLGGYSKVSDK